jgi:GTP-binding protein
VGKSSLLNFLLNVKHLAKTSSTPGKTKLINHFLINESWYLVDLPGYGYAKAGRKTRGNFIPLIGEYLLKRENLACLFILLDSRHHPLNNDLEFITWAGENRLPIALVFTKTDKVSKDMLASNLVAYKKTLLQQWDELPVMFTTSSVQRTGEKEVLRFIEKTNKVFNKGPGTRD